MNTTPVHCSDASNPRQRGFLRAVWCVAAAALLAFLFFFAPNAPFARKSKNSQPKAKESEPPRKSLEAKPAAQTSANPPAAGPAPQLTEAEKKSIAAQMKEAERWFTPHDAQFGRGAGVSAPAPDEKATLHADAAGLTVKPWSGDWTLSFSSKQNAAPKANEDRVEWERSPGVTEWLHNGAKGPEHGFTVRSAPSDGKVRVDLDLETSLRATLEPGNTGLEFTDESGALLARYSGLVAFDAAKKSLPAQMELTGSKVSLVVDAAGASFPITIDPFISLPKGIHQSDAADGVDPDFSYDISISGDRMAVTGKLSNAIDSSGYVYIYERDLHGAWQRKARLGPAPDNFTSDGFSSSVALDGNRIVVGCGLIVPPNGAGIGAAKVFERQPDGTWPEVATLHAAAGFSPIYLGASAAIFGDTIALGTYSRNDPYTGEVYLFTRQANGTWVQAQRLLGADSVAYDHFGGDISMGNGIIAIGASGHSVGAADGCGAVYIFERPAGGGSWNQTAKLVAAVPKNWGAMGHSVSLYQYTVAAGMPYSDSMSTDKRGEAVVFQRTLNGTWPQIDRFHAPDGVEDDSFGRSVAVGQGVVVVGAPAAPSIYLNTKGAAYVMRYSAGKYEMQEKLNSVPPNFGYLFGSKVAISGTALAVSETDNQSIAFDMQGRVHTYERSGHVWAQAGGIPGIATDPGIELHALGDSLSLRNGWLLVGAPWTYNQARGGNAVGAAYLFERHADGPQTWKLRASLLGTDTDTADSFGSSVALLDDTAIVGAKGRSAAYIFHRDQGGPGAWGQKKKCADAPQGSQAGVAISVEGDLLAVGAPNELLGHGRVRVYARNQGGANAWGVLATVENPVAGNGADKFGSSVALSDARLLVGAPEATGLNANGAVIHAGQAHIFERHLGGENSFGLRRTFPKAPSGIFGQYQGFFGQAVALDGDCALISEPGTYGVAPTLHFLERNQGGEDLWNVSRTVIPPAGFPGYSVALSDGIAASGGGNGVAIYHRNAGGTGRWGLMSTLRDRKGGIDGHNFGRAISLDGATLAVGEPGADDTGSSTGAVRIYERLADSWRPTASQLGSDTQQMDYFGASVALSGDFLAVGAPLHANSAGAAYLFRRNVLGSDAWGQVRKLTDSSSIADARYGACLSMSGGKLAIGQPGRNRIDLVMGNLITRYNVGGVLVYERNEGGSEQWGLSDSVHNPVNGQLAENDYFGQGVSIDGDTLAVGAPADAQNLGKVRIYRRGIVGYTLEAEPNPLMVLAKDNFGWSVAVKGDSLIVGAPTDAYPGVVGAGSVFLFSRNGGIWTDAGHFFDDVPNFEANFGRSVAIVRDVAAVGAPGDSTVQMGAGAVRLIQRDHLGAWALGRKLTAASPAVFGEFGQAVALRDELLVVGSPAAGTVHVFERWSADCWKETRIITDPADAEPYDNFGSALALDADTLAVGANGYSIGGTKIGSVSMFTLVYRPWEMWQQAFFTPAELADFTKEATLWGPYADPDGDKIPNVMECYFLMHPKSADGSLPPMKVFRDSTGAFVYQWEHDPYHRGVRCAPQWSVDLTEWWDIGQGPEIIGPREIELRCLGPGNGIQRVRSEAVLHAQDLDKAFLRLKFWCE